MWQDNSRRVRTHEKNSGETVRRLGTIIQSIFCAQSGPGVGLNFWKQLGESRYPGALSPVLENFRPALSPDATDCPWVSEDVSGLENMRTFRTPQGFKATSFWQPRASFTFLSNVWAKYRLTAHFKPEKVSSLIENVRPRPRGAFLWLWRWGAPPPKSEKMSSTPEPHPYKRP